jgi:hypothetical protein
VRDCECSCACLFHPAEPTSVKCTLIIVDPLYTHITVSVVRHIIITSLSISRRRFPIYVHIIIHFGPAPAAQQLGGARNILPHCHLLFCGAVQWIRRRLCTLRSLIEADTFTSQLNLHHHHPRRRPSLRPLASASLSLAIFSASLIILTVLTLARVSSADTKLLAQRQPVPQ